jgi:putative spermidine/putrescine transport system permease protein
MSGSRVADALGIGAILAVAALALLLLTAPSLVVLAISFDTRAFVAWPPQGFTLDWYAQVFRQDVLVEAMVNSLQVGVAVTALCVALGVPTALACVRGRFRGASALSVFVLAPHMVPGAGRGAAVHDAPDRLDHVVRAGDHGAHGGEPAAAPGPRD